MCSSKKAGPSWQPAFTSFHMHYFISREEAYHLLLKPKSFFRRGLKFHIYCKFFTNLVRSMCYKPELLEANLQSPEESCLKKCNIQGSSFMSKQLQFKMLHNFCLKQYAIRHVTLLFLFRYREQLISFSSTQWWFFFYLAL